MLLRFAKCRISAAPAASLKLLSMSARMMLPSNHWVTPRSRTCITSSRMVSMEKPTTSNMALMKLRCPWPRKK
eukprot:7729108-Lingulodinium_polyedra.AAC.1